MAEYSYHEDGTLQKVCFANGIETEYTYDADKNYRSITTKTAEGEILLDYTYQYDRNGNHTQKTGAEHVIKHKGNDSSVGTTSYLYDSLQRLQEVSYPTGMVEQYQYDQAGNRALKKYGTAENFKTGSYLEEHYTYDNRNRLLERNNPQNVTYYQYDNQGNTVSELTKRYLKQGSIKTQKGSTTTITTSMAQTEVEQYKTYEYDSFNKTARIVVEDYPSQNTEGHSITAGREVKAGKMVHIQRNFYDAEDLRYGIEEDGERTNFVTNGWSVFTELDVEWKPTKRLIRGYGIVASEEIEQSAEREPKTFAEIQNQKLAEKYHFYHQNEHGDTEYITGSKEEVTNAYTYDAFGTIINSSELVKNRYTYNGEQYDQISQQYYLRARNYNPLVGRFTQEDVYRGDGLNLYAYCGNNPVMYVDPSGYDQIPVSEMSYSDIKQELRKVYSDFVEKKNSNVSSTGNGLLNNELDYGRYGSISKPSGDDLTGHHMPSNDYMKKNFNISKNDSWAMNLEQPNTSGRHRRTFTYGLSSDSRGKQLYDALTPRDALAFDMYDTRRILIEDGVYNADAKNALKNYINDYTSQEKVGSSRSKRNKSKTSFKDIFSKDSDYNERSSKCNNS